MTPSQGVPEPPRLARADRREDLLDAALALVAAGDVDGVSMETVADRAGVSRALVYKHFANRAEILTALYERESTRLHNELSADVVAARTLVDKYRALCHGSLAAAKARGQIFEGLRSAAGRNQDLRKVQRERDRTTAATYVRQAVDEFGVAKAKAEPVTLLLLGAITPMLSAWHAHPTDKHAAELEDAYMCLVTGALRELRGSANANKPSRAKNASTDAGHPPTAEELSSLLVSRLQEATPDQLRDILVAVVTTLTGTQDKASVGVEPRNR